MRSPEGTDRYFSSETTQSGNASENRSTPENDSSTLESQQPDSTRKHFLEKAGQTSQITDSNYIKILQGNHLASSSKDVAIKVLSPGSTEKVILDCTKSEQGCTTEEGSSKCTADDSFTLDSQEKDSPTGHTLESSVKLAQGNPFIAVSISARLFMQGMFNLSVITTVPVLFLYMELLTSVF